MHKVNSIGHLQRAHQLLLMPATYHNTKRAHTHIQHALTSGGMRFGGVLEIPPHVLKMIAGGLGNAEKLHALMRSNKVVHDALKPFVLPQKWMRPGPNISNKKYLHSMIDVEPADSDQYEYYCKDALPSSDGLVTKVRFAYCISARVNCQRPPDDTELFLTFVLKTFLCDVDVNTTVQNVLDHIRVPMMPIEGTIKKYNTPTYDDPGWKVYAYHSKAIFTDPGSDLTWGDYDKTPLQPGDKIINVMRTVCDNPIVFYRVKKDCSCSAEHTNVGSRKRRRPTET